MSSKLIIAIDGPAGAGKGTVAQALAKRLNYTYIDSGAMYRAVALFALRAGLDWENNEAVGQLASQLKFIFEPRGNIQRLIVNNEDITGLIRTPEISHGSSVVAAQPAVFEALRKKQQGLGRDGGIVMEGRQIGSDVFPNAEVKIYLDATLEERTRRRIKQQQDKSLDHDQTFEQVREEIVARDRRDMQKPFGALRKPADAIEVMTDGINQEQVIDKLEQIVQDYLDRTSR